MKNKNSSIKIGFGRFRTDRRGYIMKHIAMILFIGLLCCGYGTLYAADTLENAIEKEANYIISRTPAGTVLALLSIECESELLSEYVTERTPDFIIENTKDITVVDRNQLDKIQQEIDFQYSGEVSDETMVSIGKKIGAQIIVTGSIVPAGKVYNFNVKVLNVETATMLGSNSVQIIHDEIMDDFMGNSSVAELLLAQARQKQEKREARVNTTKNLLGIFSNGFYVGYLGSLAMPVGISLGGLSEGAALFFETGFGPPVFQGYDRSDNVPSGFSNSDGGEETSFLWDAMLGLNINIIKTVLWFDIGGGVQYRQDYQLYNQTWVKDDSGGQWKGVVSAGLLVKLWYFYVQAKYKYVIMDEINSDTYGLNHISLGAGIVVRK